MYYTLMYASVSFRQRISSAQKSHKGILSGKEYERAALQIDDFNLKLNITSSEPGVHNKLPQ